MAAGTTQPARNLRAQSSNSVEERLLVPLVFLNERVDAFGLIRVVLLEVFSDVSMCAVHTQAKYASYTN